MYEPKVGKAETENVVYVDVAGRTFATKVYLAGRAQAVSE